MKAILLVLLMAPSLAIVVRADALDDTRGMLYRIDADARSVFIHPGESSGQAQALQRTANDASDRLRKQGLPAEGAALKREARQLADAARTHEDAHAKEHAFAIEQLVREVDEALPPRQEAP